MMQSGINNIADIPMNKQCMFAAEKSCIICILEGLAQSSGVMYMDNDKILMSEPLFEFLTTRVISINYPAGRECEKTVHIRNSLIT